MSRFDWGGEHPREREGKFAAKPDEIVTRAAPVSVGCGAHRYHWPKPLYLELHHVVPQAWQRSEASPVRAGDPAPHAVGRALWDARTVALCRTGHGNVHIHLVGLMKAKPPSEDPADARRFYPGRGKEYELAYLALVRWKEAGGSLQTLREAGQWGGMFG